VAGVLMTLRVNIKHDVNRALRALGNDRVAVKKAAARALTRTADQVRSAAVKEIARETGIKQKDVRVALKRVRAKPTNLISAVIAIGRAVNLIRFTRQTRRQARKAGGVVANAWGVRRLYRGAFIGNAGRTVFTRAPGASRLPIRAKHGPSIPREMAREKVAKHLERVIRTRWPINFEADMRFYLSRSK
jgi:hypothetical protein